MAKHRQTKATDISKAVKLAVLDRDGGVCINCGATGLPEAHFIGKAQGGLGIEENIVTLCRECHSLYDNSEQRGEIRKKLRRYLQSKYDGWNEKDLYYHKYKFVEQKASDCLADYRKTRELLADEIDKILEGGELN